MPTQQLHSDAFVECLYRSHVLRQCARHDSQHVPTTAIALTAQVSHVAREAAVDRKVVNGLEA